MTTISCRTILRSRNAAAPEHVLSTLLLRYPRWIHAEGRTHRLLDIGEDFSILPPTPSLMECDDLSRNAASSRAIPVSKMIEDVRRDPARPLYWGKNVAGMQAKEELTGDYLRDAERLWDEAMEAALSFAEQMSYLGVEDDKAIGAHKQIINRLLEPFSHITVLVSATEWTNFLELRDHADAEPHIAILAREIRKCLDDESTIQTLQPGEWHLPFVEGADWDSIRSAIGYSYEYPKYAPAVDQPAALDNAIKLSVARAGSTSYKTVDGFDMTLDRAVALHDRLLASRPQHSSPAEHVARVDDCVEGAWNRPSDHRNFIGFRQYRAMIERTV